MTYSQCEADLTKQLQTLYDAGEAQSIANWVMEEFTGSNRHQRKLFSSNQVSHTAQMQIADAAKQLLQHKPLQYVLGYTFFYGLKFRVNEAVLIPRPETEELVNWIIKDYKSWEEKINIMDIGTGSGCIPVTLKKQLPKANVSSIDVSNEALEIAKGNALENAVTVAFQQLDFLDENEWKRLGEYDIIVSNPPYIPQQEKAAMDMNVAGWEPATALFVPDKSPLLFYEKIALFGKTHLAANGTIYMETHKDYTTNVHQLFMQQGYTAELKKDMHGNDRMVKARKLAESSLQLAEEP